MEPSSSLTRKHREKVISLTQNKENKPPPSIKVKAGAAPRAGLKTKEKYKPPVPGVAQKTLILTNSKKKKKEQPVLQVKPLHCIRETHLYDEHWIRKEERSFMKWSNFVLAPTDQCGNVLPTQGKSAPLKSMLTFDDTSPVSLASSTAPTILSQQRQASRRRQACSRLYESEPCTHVLSRLEIEIEAGRLSIRPEYSPHSDVGKRESLLQLFLNYNPVWLQLGLEVIFSEQIIVNEESSLPQTLSLYIQSRILRNSQIVDRYYHSSVPGRYGKGLNEAICQYVLKKFLSLVLLLDKAKLTRLIDYDPCLFSKDSSVKSSRELLLTFCRDFLSSEGDLIRHLQYLNYSVSVVQHPIDEFDFSITNIATDLQDGLRLVRLSEILTSQWGLSSQVRIPASTKAQKLHNVELALKCLSGHMTIPVGTTSLNIVEGHREKTLGLLWSIIFHFKIKIKLNFKDLKEEIAYLSTRKPHPIAAEYYNPRHSSIEPSLFFTAPELNVLLEWCRAVGKLYGVPINNFNSSFSDGRMFCYLIHHYQPGLLPLDRITNETSTSQRLMAEPPPPSVPEPVEEDFTNGWTASFSPTTGRDKDKERLLANEKSNFKLLSQTLPLLGGVPMLVHSKDMSDTLPDEKVVISFVSYLCHRLMILRKETRSAVVLQRAWRKIKQRKRERCLMSLRNNAATFIQATFRRFIAKRKYSQLLSATHCLQVLWRAKRDGRRQRRIFLAKRRAAVILQRAYRHHRAIKEDRAAKLIQTCYRGYICRSAYLKMRTAAIILQSSIKSYLSRKHYVALKQSALKLQAYWRATLQSRREREQYQQLRAVTIATQARYRGKKIRERFVSQRNAAIIIQAIYRGYLSRKHYFKLTLSVSVIQAYWRATLKARKGRQSYLRSKQAAIVIQSHFRRWQVQQQLSIQHKAATLIQSHVRGYISRSHYHCLKHSTSTLQSYWRATLLARKERECFLQLKQAVIIIQSYFRRWQLAIAKWAATLIQSIVRGYLSRHYYLTVKAKVSLIQSHWRATLLARHERQSYLQLKQSTIIIQSYVRRWQVQQQLAIQHKAATLIQSRVKGYISRQHYQNFRLHVVLLQTYWRATLLAMKEREKYLHFKQAATMLQSHFRRWQVQQQLSIQHEAARLIQSQYRGHTARHNYQATRAKIILLQSHWRATLLARKEREDYINKRRAAITLQSHFRRWKVQKQLAIQHKAATLIQSHIKCHIASQNFATLKLKVIRLQVYWRATLLARKERESYLDKRRAAILIQSHFRRWQVQQQLSLQHQAATLIQSLYRGYSRRQHYLAMRNSALLIQSYWRATVACRREREAYLQLKHATITLQSHFRRWQVQQQLSIQHEAARLIQSQYRGYTARHNYQATRAKIILLQSHWRATLLARKERDDYINKRRAVIKLQSHFRRWQVQKQLFLQHQAATLIQSHVKCYFAMQKYLLLKSKVILLQLYWRATLLARNKREEYLKNRRAAITIQSHFKRWQVQKQLAIRHEAATLIQSHVKRYIASQNFATLKLKIICLQAYWRATLLARKERESYLDKRRAAILIQSHFRRWQVQQQLSIQHEAARLIQSQYRGYTARHNYQAIRAKIILLQSHWRATLLARKEREDYINKRRAVITLQSHFRRWQVQKQLFLQHQAATLIQSHVKCYFAAQKYLLLKSKVILLQLYWRATLLARNKREEYLKNRRAAITIQSHFRRWKVQKQLAIQHEAATLIQSHVRGHLASQKYVTLKLKIIHLQAYWRATLLARKEREIYLDKRRAAITLQSHFKRWQVQKQLAIQHEAATLIQSHVKRYIASQNFANLKLKIICLQAYWRATLLARKERESYLDKKSAAIFIQSHFRRWRVQQQLSIQHEAARLIQSQYRGYTTRHNYQAIRAKIFLLQSHWRATLLARKEREDYINKRRAAITLQSHFRRWKVQQQLAIQDEAATLIQSHVRGYIAAQKYSYLKLKVIHLQAYWRATLLARKERESYLDKRSAAITLQSHFRRWQVQQQLAIQHEAATLIQSHVRGYIAAQKYSYLKLKVIHLQAYWRATLLARKERESYLDKRSAAITLQSHFRRWQVQQQLAIQHKAATFIQSQYRCYHTRQTYLYMVAQISILQTYWRATVQAIKERESYLQLKQAAIVIQSHFRRWQVQQQLSLQHQAATLIQSQYRGYSRRQHYLAMRNSALLIQSYWRATVACRREREAYLQLKHAAVTLQSHFRRWKVQQQLSIQHEAARLIQSQYRGYTTRHNYQAIRAKIIQLQSHWRATLLARKEREDYINKRRAAITLQSHFRRWKVQQQLAIQHEAATLIQSHVRGHLASQKYWRATLLARKGRQEYLQLKAATLLIQSYYRQLKRERAAIMIQASYRAHYYSMRYTCLKEAAVFIQSKWRAKVATREAVDDYKKIYRSVVFMQSCIKSVIAKRKYLSVKASMVLLQAQVRRYLGQKRYHTQRDAAICIQRYYQSYLLAMERKREAKRREWAARVIQRRFLIYYGLWEEKRKEARRQAAVCIQRHIRGFLAIQYIKRRQEAALKIQSYWRGYRVRHSIKRKAVHEARKRIEKANKSSKSSLRVRLPLMLEELHRTRYLSTAADILKVFELITGVSEHCSRVIVEGNALTVLYEYISTSNRSRATLEVVKVCLLILFNILKWPSTQFSVLCDEKSLTTMIDFMHKIYVTQPDIMLISCQLLQKYCQINPHRSFPEASYRKLVSIRSVLQRKSKAGGTKLHNPTKNEQPLTSLNLLNAIIQSSSSSSK
uniref:Calponin-homology (CH) domain-containing protein n=2 Tax=Amphimedon queenslandica TaxID=400682 RepID=A0A1X7V6E3_AMPQE